MNSLTSYDTNYLQAAADNNISCCADNILVRGCLLSLCMLSSLQKQLNAQAHDLHAAIACYWQVMDSPANCLLEVVLGPNII